MLVHMRDMLVHAYQNGYAVGAFDLVSLDFLEGILKGAERLQAPVILSLAESHFDYFDFDTIMPSVVAAARRSLVPVAIHLDHGSCLDSAIQAIRLGCNGVMVDASSLPFQENVARTKEVVAMAHGCGVPVEGELGYVAGVEGEDAERHPGEVIYTSVEEARAYVEATGVDFLAVSIGTVHGRMRGEPRLDFERLAAIDEALGIPLVIHGGTGLSEEQYKKLIEGGVAKINYFTALSEAAGKRILENAKEAWSYTGLVKGVREAIQEEVERMSALWGSAGRAEAVRMACRPWREVEHVILYNASVPENEVEKVMEEGKAVLSPLPGVREVVTGKAVGEAPYRYAWLIRFASPEVIATYGRDPRHRAFADQRFKPLAPERVKGDYEET